MTASLSAVILVAIGLLSCSAADVSLRRMQSELGISPPATAEAAPAEQAPADETVMDPAAEAALNGTIPEGQNMTEVEEMELPPVEDPSGTDGTRRRSLLRSLLNAEGTTTEATIGEEASEQGMDVSPGASEAGPGVSLEQAVPEATTAPPAEAETAETGSAVLPPPVEGSERRRMQVDGTPAAAPAEAAPAPVAADPAAVPVATDPAAAPAAPAVEGVPVIPGFNELATTAPPAEEAAAPSTTGQDPATGALVDPREAEDFESPVGNTDVFGGGAEGGGAVVGGGRR
ncbi:unnamed protein product [Vitrella brassicaformis CCMP3155]|uniref:Uncharacterized protein n=1 Tax=Vitrella brassicaformis (strain CCMP3155) TaxID=1169540 RepID=A0A0G4FX45_VITBC|nr:unnamed protein product [Vitrella brassicaformis CCMP3155]|mmetsp:Transcript_21946/g.53826  ORF Transcript_21946/g.53826 Transcript_21946/m.53826 type:complete len:288 (-) Transcript_21946:465-1328(-)|eukprot:CEM19539.1 unnamed protein product [Vitrella brassicaformis CCMP3155]